MWSGSLQRRNLSVEGRDLPCSLGGAAQTSQEVWFLHQGTGALEHTHFSTNGELLLSLSDQISYVLQEFAVEPLITPYKEFVEEYRN